MSSTQQVKTANSARQLRRMIPVQLVAIVLVVLSLAYFCSRGPVRYFRSQGSNDSTQTYLNARAWLAGDNPYLASSMERHWQGTPIPRMALNHTFSLPPTVPLFAPVSWLPWEGYKILHGVIALAAFFGMILLLIDMFELSGTRRLYFAAFATAFAPAHTAYSVGNISAILIPAIVFCWYLARRGQLLLAGLVLGLGLCIKPQLFLPVAVFLLFRKCWSSVILGTATLVGCFLLFVVFAAPGWANAFYERASVLQVGGSNYFALTNPARYQLLNFQVIPATFGVDRTICTLLAFAVAAVLGLIWLRSSRPLLPLVLISFIPFYHRVYEAEILIAVIAFAFSVRDRRILWLCAPFLLPLPTILYQLVPVTNAFWGALVLSHQIWLIIAISIVYLWRARSLPARLA